MSGFLYLLLAIAHGVVFTLNIITCIHLAPIIGENATTGYGLMMSIGTMASAALTLLVYPDETPDEVVVFIVIHSALLTGMGFAAYYYVPMLIS